MILDTSAVIAIMRGETEAEGFSIAIAGADMVGISAGTVLEAQLVIGAARSSELDDFLRECRAVVLPVDDTTLRIARWAAAKYGKGTGHPARLNYGDCFSYATATVTEQPLLFKGDDFIHTDVGVAWVRDPSGPEAP